MQNNLCFMIFALQLATLGKYTVSPNPMVGCVIVKNQRIVGHGYHTYAGGPHAEIMALNAAGKAADQATLYVTLEPCCFSNRTPPCTDAIIASGIKKIIIATVDPNPKVNGKGLAQLRAAGIDIEIGLCEKEAITLNEIFFHYIKQHRPFVIAKWAMSFDGKTITQINDSRQISNHTSQQHAHDIRQQVDAILIGANTAITDDPALTVRYTQQISDQQPYRIILSSTGNLPLHLKLLNDNYVHRTIVATTHAIPDKTYQALIEKNINIILIKQKNNQVDLNDLLIQLGKLEITSILIEGGDTIHQSFFKENLVNRVQVYLAPCVIATLPIKKILTNVNFTPLNNDYFFNANIGDSTHV